MFAVSFPEKWISEFNGSTLDMYAGFSPEKFWTGFDPRRRHEEKHLRTMVLGCFFFMLVFRKGDDMHMLRSSGWRGFAVCSQFIRKKCFFFPWFHAIIKNDTIRDRNGAGGPLAVLPGQCPQTAAGGKQKKRGESRCWI